jgi:hypothetical protein
MAKQERIMPQIEVLYVVEFGDVAIGGQTYTYWNGGVAVLETSGAAHPCYPIVCPKVT